MTDNPIVAEIARSWIGTPYQHQASVRDVGADCLGLIRGIWRSQLGSEPCQLPGYTQDWGECSGDEVLRQAADRWLIRIGNKPQYVGSVLLFRIREKAIAKHLGILVSLGSLPTFIHAYSGHGVVESPLSDPWRRRIAAVYAFPKES
ncbi:NlpC/P60 family protein [Thioclava sp. FR2]|uniref:NlpC/P60 family protein n=1 Tax=Thioclava sp. FR2 TaxID=3445780 RepID=UPI003EBB001F